ncbi:MAG: hypothetical protein CVT92_06940 [Bacteroidetes bacterium HGW-Bacteroidetes-1]|jgi:hypothetical protein|nr:MAG: hypothetical protein CVT92_06940 [Bacteroidetes bacterium HGW-Bacteroidetes-1]
MKKFFSVVIIVLVVVFIAALLLPYVFRGKIVSLVKQEINKSINAKVDFQKASLSFFNNFPDLTLSLNNLQIIGNVPFESDTLLFVKELRITMDLKSVFKGSPYEIKKIGLKQPNVNLISLKDGTVNWDIAKTESDSPEEIMDETEASFELGLQEVSIEDGFLLYDDRELIFLLEAEELNGSLYGNLTLDQTDITTIIKSGSLSMNYDGMTLLNNVSAVLNTVIDANLAQSIYKIRSNRLLINELELEFDGSFSLGEDDIGMDFKFKAPEGDFKQLLSLIPVIYSNEFNSIQAEGGFAFDGFMKGRYSELTFPGFGMNLKVDNAFFAYKDMPQKMENISIIASVDNISGDFNDTFLNLEKFNFLLEGNPFAARLELKNPVKNPQVDAALNGTINMSSLSALLPLTAIPQMKGLVKVGLEVRAALSDVENKNYQNVFAKGAVIVTDAELPLTTSDAPLLLKAAQFDFAPEKIQMNFDELLLGRSDFMASGTLENYLDYFLGEGTLNGNMQMKSTLIDMNELMKIFGAEAETESIDSSAFSVDLPERMDLFFSAKADQLIFENYDLKSVEAGIQYKDKIINFNPLSAKLLGGSMSMKGVFDATNNSTPEVAFDFNIKSFEIPLAYQSIGLFQKAAPIAEKTTGNFSTVFRLKGKLDGVLNPVFESLQGGGTLQSSQIKIESVNAMTTLAELLGNESYKRLITDGIDFTFEFINGRVFQKPFTLKYAGNDVTMGGSIGFDQILDYDMVFQIPFAQLGSKIADGISDIVKMAGNQGVSLNPGTSVQIKAKITGSATDPKISLDYKNFAADLKTDITNIALQEIEKQKEALKAKVSDEANKLLQQAREQGENLIKQAENTAENIRSEAAKVTKQLRDEANKQADKITADGKANGMLAELAAVETAKQIKQQADKNALKFEEEADQRAAQLIYQARIQSEKLLQEAQRKADGLLD